jgi:hypothetical protein
MSKNLRENFPDAQLYLIDPWRVDRHYNHNNPDVGFEDDPGKTQEGYEAAYELVKKMFENDPLVDIIRKNSVEAAATFDDGSLDIVFIDGDHSTDAVISDIAAWKPKVKKGGLLTGHDHSFHNVKKAIDIALPRYITGPDAVWVHQVQNPGLGR